MEPFNTLELNIRYIHFHKELSGIVTEFVQAEKVMWKLIIVENWIDMKKRYISFFFKLNVSRTESETGKDPS